LTFASVAGERSFSSRPTFFQYCGSWCTSVWIAGKLMRMMTSSKKKLINSLLCSSFSAAMIFS